MVRYIINASALRKLEEELFQPDTGRKAGLSFKLIDINQAIAEIAGCLRGNQQFLKAIDALQIASAIHVGGSPGNEFPGSSTEVPSGLQRQSEAIKQPGNGRLELGVGEILKRDIRVTSAFGFGLTVSARSTVCRSGLLVP